ncbi:MAG: bifunctional phosphopantothenoylcysteine decarboxylase/phosphopantothenate synthase [Candidatus Uhrbacteria bacterium]|nr:bifunctional phosphopantothenoylcysteine decarboxylase/phosphopantothenate synthase [Candidatus Uhrbacteria bacterium]
MKKQLNILVTSGRTAVPGGDKVRELTNKFKGRTGNEAACQLRDAGHHVTLLTSSPERVPVNLLADSLTDGSLTVIPFNLYDELMVKMEYAVKNGGFDVIIHSAAVSDYKVQDAFIPVEGPYFGDGRVVVKPLPKAGKMKSNHKRLFLELVPTEKIVDKIRRDWEFKGVLVKFKLEVGLQDDELIDIARASRAQSDANMIVANCLEWSKDYAYVIGHDNVAHMVVRDQIASEILRRVA